MENLTEAAGTIAIDEVELIDNTLRVELAITNLAGHKLPSAYPSRRVWIHLTVKDDQGDVQFESGRFNPAAPRWV